MSLGRLAFNYDFGRDDFPKDEKLAIKYYLDFVSKADKTYSDYKVALYNLGQIYYFGKYGVSKDPERAISYYKESASLGYEDSKKRINEIEEEKKARKKSLIVIVLSTLVYLFFSVKAMIADRPFWILFWGIICILFCLLWVFPTFNDQTHSRSLFSSLLPATVTCAYFIIRAVSYGSTFWMWFWIVIFVFCLGAVLVLFFIGKD